MQGTRWPCLEFVKTRGWEARDRPDDALVDYASLVRWARGAALIDGGTGRALRAWSGASPGEAARAVRRARSLRDALYRTFVAVARDQPIDASCVASLNRAVRSAMHVRELRSGTGGLEWKWSRAGDRAGDAVLWRIGFSAMELLTDRRTCVRLRLCASHDCGWLFVDESRNAVRRWCSMGGCGNVEKSRRHRARQRASSP